MNLLKISISGFIYLFVIPPLVAFAHESEILHEEAVPTISPLLLIWIVLGLAIAGFLLWKFVLRGHKSSEKIVSQSDEKKSP